MLTHGLALEHMHLVKGLDPVADAFSQTITSDVVNLAAYDKAIFIIHKGVGTTGTSAVKMYACDDVVPTTRAAIPFRYRAITTGDTEGAITDATAAAGFTTTAGSSQLYAIEVNKEDLAASGYGYVQLEAIESVNDPVLGGILVCMCGPLNAGSTNRTAIT